MAGCVLLTHLRLVRDFRVHRPCRLHVLRQLFELRRRVGRDVGLNHLWRVWRLNYRRLVVVPPARKVQENEISLSSACIAAMARTGLQYSQESSQPTRNKQHRAQPRCVQSSCSVIFIAHSCANPPPLPHPRAQAAVCAKAAMRSLGHLRRVGVLELRLLQQLRPARLALQHGGHLGAVRQYVSVAALVHAVRQAAALVEAV